jgi:hypothetical protein
MPIVAIKIFICESFKKFAPFSETISRKDMVCYGQPIFPDTPASH